MLSSVVKHLGSKQRTSENSVYLTQEACSKIIRESKLDVTWSYVKRQTANMTYEFAFFSSNPSLNHIKNRKMSPTIRHKYKCFILTFQRAKDRRQKFHFCRLPFDLRPRNAKLNLSNGATFIPGQDEKLHCVYIKPCLSGCESYSAVKLMKF